MDNSKTAAIDLSEKTILMTGAFSAIAEYVVRTLAEAGATLILTDVLESNAAERKMTELDYDRPQCEYHEMDVTAPAEVRQVVDAAFEKHPRINIVLGHAGGTALQPFRDSDAERFDQIVRFNFLGQTYLARAVLNQWTRRKTAGHLIFTSSYVTRVPHEGIAAYAGSKAATETFARVLALEYAEQGVRFNMIAPGNVAAGSSLKVYEEDASYRNMVDRMTPLGRRNTPEAIANAFLFLCSDLATEMNGQVLTVDNGVTVPQVG